MNNLVINGGEKVIKKLVVFLKYIFFSVPNEKYFKNL